jgi:hypothetical protein
MSRRTGEVIRAVLSQTIWILAGAAFASLLVVRGLAGLGRAAPYPLILLGLAAIAATWLVVRLIGAQTVPPTVFHDPPTDRSFPEADDAVHREIALWAVRMEHQREDAHRAGNIHRQLVDLVGERLHRAHGINVVTEPERVRQLIGAHLWRFLTSPPRPLQPAEMADLLTDLEAL